MKRFIGLFLAALVLSSCCSSGFSGSMWSPGQGARQDPDDRLTVKDLLRLGPTAVSPTAEEKKLYDLITAYRAQRGLPSIPYSKSLSFVARIHVRDLMAHPASAPCNAHSWSADGPWSGGCYTPDHKAADIMWDKPRELTKYPGDGYEIAFGEWSSSGGSVNAASALAGWKSSPPHHAVIINQGTWADSAWKAIGIGIYRNYAVVWFGEEEDTEK